MKYITLVLALLVSAVSAAQKPNILLIMADDMGYETVGVNGCESYKTPHLDKMAAEGMRFTNCFANPLCTPSRVKIMTGQYNTRNYVQFRVLDRSQKTFAHYLKDAGYKTAVAGKWQLGKEKDSAQHFGFDESFLWQQVLGAKNPKHKTDSRHVNPILERNGEPVEYNNGEFSADLFVEFFEEFMTENKEEPLFMYYPMVLPHCPFIPTPGTPDFDPKSYGSKSYKGNAKYFGDMVNHIDQMVARLESKLEELGLVENTLIIFTGDNGTDKPVKTQWNGREIKAGKGKMIDEGMRVPLIVKMPGKVKAGVVTDELVDFADFLPTFTEMADVEHAEVIDGVSLSPVLFGEGVRNKPFAYIWYEPKKGDTPKATVMARTKEYKLQRKGESGAYVLSRGAKPFEESEIADADLNEKEQEVKAHLEKVLKKYDALRNASL